MFRNESILLVQQEDYFTHELQWTLPSGGVEDGETPVAGALRELAEESGCRLEPSELELIATTETQQGGRRLSMSWTFTAATLDDHLEPADPDGEIIDAQWFELPAAIDALSRHPYQPIREPALRFLNGERGLHWIFELTDSTSERPAFQWSPPTARRM